MSTLPTVLKSVDWSKNIENAFADAKSLESIEFCLKRIAVWSKQFEIADDNNPALCFLREMQISAQHGAALIGLCLYKPSAASARALIETCLYYTYFRTHSVELASLIRSEKYYITKNEVLEYHRAHSPNFTMYQEAFGLLTKLEKIYSLMSAVIHGQLPGSWNEHSALHQIAFAQKTNKLAVDGFLASEEVVHQLLLCTVGKSLWPSFAPDAKLFLLKSLPGDKRSLLQLDSR